MRIIVANGQVRSAEENLKVCNLLKFTSIPFFFSVEPVPKKEDKDEPVSVQDDFWKGKLMACVCLVGMFAIINFSISVMET